MTSQVQTPRTHRRGELTSRAARGARVAPIGDSGKPWSHLLSSSDGRRCRSVEEPAAPAVPRHRRTARLWHYAGVVWEAEPSIPVARGGHRSGLDADLEALRQILAVNQRGMFEFVVSEASLAEVARRTGSRSFQQWVWDVLDVWVVQSAGSVFQGTANGLAGIGSISASDRQVLSGALEHDYDALLTMDKKLASKGAVIQRATGLRVLTPVDHWGLLKPFAALYR